MSITELFLRYKCDKHERIVLLEFLRSIRISRIIREMDEIKQIFNDLNMSENKILSKTHAASMIKGVKVKMVNCFEANFHKDEVYTIRSEVPEILCNNWVVWLEGYVGAFRCDFLQIVNL